MSQSEPAQLSFEQFRQLLAQQLVIDEEKLVPEASFVEDLLVDSIRMVEMMLRLEGEGISIPFEAAWQIESVQDAYECYLDSMTAQAQLATCRGSDASHNGLDS